MHAAVLDILEPVLQPGASVLDVGSGSGILLPIFHALVRPGGRVLGVDKHEALVARSTEAVRAAAPGALEDGCIELRAANVLAPGALAHDGLFDAIHVGAAAETLPTVLVDALKPGGRLIVPVGPDGGGQLLTLVKKWRDGSVTQERLMDVRYVQLTPPGRDRYGGL